MNGPRIVRAAAQAPHVGGGGRVASGAPSATDDGMVPTCRAAPGGATPLVPAAPGELTIGPHAADANISSKAAA